MPEPGSARQRLGVRQPSAAFLARVGGSKSGRGLPHSKTWRRFRWSLERIVVGGFDPSRSCFLRSALFIEVL